MSNPAENTPEYIELEHSFFKPFTNRHFRMSGPNDETPVFAGSLGSQEVALPLRGILRELKFAEESQETAMFAAIERGLRYVTVLSPGDRMPAEILNGNASWQPEERHLELARQRVTMQLVCWLSGDERLITDPKELQALFDDPDTAQRVNDAFDEAARTLNLNSKEAVTGKVEELADALSYIECLRERFHEVLRLREKLRILRKKFESRESVLQELDPLIRLIGVPSKTLSRQFELLDVQTGEILAVLRNLEAQKEHIREQRNELHCRLVAWEKVLDDWKDVDPQTEPYGLMDMLRDLYRFLAPRFMPVDEWILVNAERNHENKPSSAMVW